MSFLPILLPVIGALVVVAAIFLTVKLMWRVAEPSEALIISGFTKGNTGKTDGMDFRIVTGKGAFVIPGLQTVRTLSLTLNETPLAVDCVTSQGIRVVVKGAVIFKIGDSPDFIANAARRFLGKQDRMQGQVYNVFEGHLRSIIGSMTVEEIIRERDKLAAGVRDASGIEMGKLGLVVDSLQIKDLEDPTEYIKNLAKPHIAQVQMEARIKEAASNREASEKEAEAAALIAAAQSRSAIQQSEARAEADRAMAEAAQAGPLAEATARQQVVVQETSVARLEADREEQKLQTTVRKPADAEAYATRTKAEAQRDANISAAEAEARTTELEAEARANAAESAARATRTTGEAQADATKATGVAEAEAIKAKALAEAEGIKARAEALGTNPDAVIAQQFAERMPEIVTGAAEPFKSISNLNVLNGAEGLNGMVGGIIAQAASYLPMLRGMLTKKSAVTSEYTPAAPTKNGSAEKSDARS